MFTKLLEFSVRNGWTILFLTLVLVAGGLYVAFNIPVEAFPDLTNNQVVITTDCPAMPPDEVDHLVTFPLEGALMGLPKTLSMRSTSKLGLSMITVVFEDNVNIYLARQQVSERLQQVMGRLPEGLQPSLGPVATAFGEVYQYTVDGPLSLMARKSLHDWQIRYDLRTVPGISEINSWGGETQQFQVVADPNALQRYGLTLHDVYSRIAENNANFGGGFVNLGSEQVTMLGRGRAANESDLGNIVLMAKGGTPVYVHDAALIRIGAMPRQGAVLRDAQGETVSGMVISQKGENGRRVIERVKAAIANLRLPEGVRIRPFYDQSEVINATIHTVRTNLIEAGFLVVAVLLAFLGNARAALIVAMVIPLSMLCGFIGMMIFGVSANLMSLGAVDFGMVVDSGVVIMENSVRRLTEDGGAHFLQTILDAGREVVKPIVTGRAIIIVVYLPMFFLTDLEGRMFRPMAITVCAALIGSLLLSLTFVPAVSTFVLRNAREGKAQWFHSVLAAYRRALEFVLQKRKAFVTAALLLVVSAVASLRYIGTEFMPRLDEGSMLITTRKLPGISLPGSVAVSGKVEQILMAFPEVTGVTTKLGRPDLATEAMGVYEADVYVGLKPRDQWITAKTREGLESAFADKLQNIPGVAYNFTQPMAMRVDEVVSGIKADVAVKIFGEDPAVLEQLASRTLTLLQAIPGSTDAQMEIISGIGEIHVDVDRAALARYGINVSAVQEMVNSATGGEEVGMLIQGDRRFPVTLRVPDTWRADLQSLGTLPIQAPGGELVRLNQVAALTQMRGPEMISRENARRRIVVQSNVRGVDLGSFVARAQKSVSANLHLPQGYSITWGGQFENQARASQRLMIILPASIMAIFVLLFASFGSVGESLLILFAVPFAMVGGIGALWIRGMNLNLSASIGFIALFGVAVLNGIVMVTIINQLRAAGSPVELAVRHGASLRLRPVLMTALVASLGFAPMAFSQAQGAEVQRPLATVVMGGLVTATILTLFLIPAAYPWFCRKHRSPVDDETVTRHSS